MWHMKYLIHPQLSEHVKGVTVPECNHFNVVRQQYFNVSSLHELFDTVHAQNVLGFIREIGFYRLL